MKKLELFLNRNCNLSCEYCEFKDNSIKEDIVDLVNLRKVITENSIEEIIILGGEPTLNNNLKYIINEFRLPFTIYTNTFKIHDYLNHKIKWKCSFHQKYMKLSDFINNINFLKDNNEQFEIIVPMDTGYNFTAYNILKNLYENVTVEPIIYLDNLKFSDCTFSNIEMCKGKSNILKTNIDNFLNFKTQKLCNIDEYQITYDFYNNRSYKCLTYLHNKDNCINKQCSYNYCFCDTEFWSDDV